MPKPSDPADVVELTFGGGRRIQVHRIIAGRVRGLDMDGDLLIPLGDARQLIRHEDDSEYLVALTPCCHASGKGADVATGVVCRGCHREVDGKYGGPGKIALLLDAHEHHHH